MDMPISLTPPSSSGVKPSTKPSSKTRSKSKPKGKGRSTTGRKSSSKASSKRQKTSSSAPKRVRGSTIRCPVIYGNIAWWLGKKAVQFEKTHRWLCFVRGPHNEDLSIWIDHVTFRLHESFPDPVKVVHKPPFEIEQVGWGEFELTITLHFKDPSEKPVTLIHGLGLYPSNISLLPAPSQQQGGLPVKGGNNSGTAGAATDELPDASSPQVVLVPSFNSLDYKSKIRPVVHEVYDEVIFVDPTVKMHQILTEQYRPRLPFDKGEGTKGVLPHLRLKGKGVKPRFSASRDLDLITHAQAKVREELQRLTQLFDDQEKELKQLNDAYEKIEDGGS